MLGMQAAGPNLTGHIARRGCMAQQMPPPPGWPRGNQRARMRSLVGSLVVNAACPFLIYYLLKHYTAVSDLVALLATGVPSVLDSIVGIVRRHRIDVIAGVVLAGIAVSLVLIALGGSTRLYLIRESFFTAAFGLAYLISLLFPKPLAFYFARQFMVGHAPEGIAGFDSLWQHNALFRHVTRQIGLVWSFGLLLEAAVRTYLVFTLSVTQFLVVSPIVLYGITGCLTVWTFWFARRARRRGEEARRRLSVAAPELPSPTG
jgi:hypothetical protein